MAEIAFTAKVFFAALTTKETTMNAKHICIQVLAGFALAAALPVTAAEFDLIREMARSDGNPNGDTVAVAAPERPLSKDERARLDIFIAELSRTDGGSLAAREAESASDTTVARR